MLGAAVGEAVLGRQLGNRAMLWGGIAGTLPDLDVLSGLVTDPMSALAYHRAFTHSLPFAVAAAPLIGWVVHRMHRRNDGPQWPTYLAALTAFWLLLVTGSYLMPVEVYGIPSIASVVTLVFAAICGLAGRYSSRLRVTAGQAGIPANTGLPANRELGKSESMPISQEKFARAREVQHPNPSVAHWTLLFFLSIVTHPLLDCFTAYGTQFFEPFSAFRIAWNTVSVVDPFYTLPFVLLLIFAARSGRGTRVRKSLNLAGLLVSSAYLLLTVINHFNVSSVLDHTLASEGIIATRTVIGPGIGNNLLWSGSAETVEGDYFVGQYSLLDQQRIFQPLIKVTGRHALLAAYAGDRELEILRWFSNEYYTVLPLDDGHVQLNDLRYGLLGSDPNDPASYLFSWKIDTTVRPVRVVEQNAGPKKDGGKMLGRMWMRMWGV